MKKLFRHLHDFFFAEISAAGFGLMRIVWAGSVLAFLLGSAGDTVRYYSEVGILPEDVSHLVFRTEYRFTLLNYITDPSAVILLWSIFIFCLTLMMLGIWPRVMTTLSVLLLFSFHERNLQPLGGGDTVLRNFGFVLLVCPQLKAFSLTRLEQQWTHWKKTGSYLPPLKTAIWPYRILLWQFIIIYVTSGWDKLQGTMWLDGTVVEAVFHHTHFVRFPKVVMDTFVWMSPFASFYTLIFEFTWLLMLIPKGLWSVLPNWWKCHSLRRWLIFGALLFHWGIFVFMDVGSFPFAMTAGLCGLLMAEDFGVYRKFFNWRWKGTIVVLNDGACGLCRRAMFALPLLDGLRRCLSVDFRDTALRKKYAPDVTEQSLDRAMHIRLPDGSYKKGFYAFRTLAWHIPLTFLIAPLLYLPGVAPVGNMVYEKVAASRDRCSHGQCKL